MKKRINGHRRPRTKDGRVPTLTRLQPVTLQRLDARARHDRTTRAEVMQRALDEWLAR